jgi:homocitrate synthase NifV
MLKNSHAYEPYQAYEVGLESSYPIGKHSGSAAIRYHLTRMGISADNNVLSDILPKIREIVTKRKRVLDLFELRSLYQDAACI